MNLTYDPLLQIQRDLFDLPRGPQRFARYRALLHDKTTGAVRCPPLLIVNPMGRDPVADRLDALLALDADAVAARAVAELAGEVADAPGGDFRVAVVVADDVGGGWTNRYAWEFSRWFERPPAAQRGWLCGVLWTGDPPPTPDAVRAAVRTAVLREDRVQRRGVAATLRERLAQEGEVLARAGRREPSLSPEELAQAREVIRPHLDSTDLPTSMVHVFGDPAAVSLGYALPGLPSWAGLALALHDARKNPG